MLIESDIKLDFDDVLIMPKQSSLSSRQQIDLIREYTFYKNNYQYNGIPIIAANMDGVGTIEMAKTLSKKKLFTCLTKFIDRDDIENIVFNDETLAEYTAPTIGIADEDIDWIEYLTNNARIKPKYACIDVANGYSDSFVEFVRKFRMKNPVITIIAGNVATGDQTYALINAGATIVKIGIGSGAQCLTRVKSGVGYPQLSAIIECADVAHGKNAHIISDGGCNNPGDVAKAFAAGADFVMLGSMLAGTDQGGGEIIEKHRMTDEVEIINTKVINSNNIIPKIETRKFVKFYGMSSKTANDKHFGGLKDYRSSEGRTTLIPYKGDVGEVVNDILGGIRSACTYVGAKKLKSISKCTTFIQCNQTHNRSHEKYSIGE